ncbi:hypothetical protein [Gaoshiqia sp. Z1-71]|uniref:hypothetical protein n=1 Tax=Gaoshiqia hydrogeniformans TaxID=3290090 RepID=UPI003BF7E5AA
MELKDLQSAWSKYSSTEASKHQLNEADLRDMLKKRTKGLIESIDRNIRTGFAFLLLLTLFFVFDDFILTPYYSGGAIVPSWIILIDGLSTVLIIATFTFFSLKYRKVKQDYSQTDDLQKVVRSIIRILATYRRLFYIALTVLLFVLAVAFVTGMFTGVEKAAFRQGISIDELDRGQMTASMIKGLVLLVSFMTLLFLLFRWGFRKLYGNYIAKLQATLEELDEVE